MQFLKTLTLSLFLTAQIPVLGSLNIYIVAPDFGEERERMFKEILDQKWLYCDCEVEEKFKKLSGQEKDNMILEKFHHQYKNYLWKKWVTDSGGTFSQSIVKSMISIGSATAIMQFLNPAQTQKIHIGTNMAIGGMVVAQVQDTLPKIANIIHQFARIYTHDIKKMHPVFAFPLSAFFSLDIKPQEAILKMFLLKAPEFTERSRAHLIPYFLTLAKSEPKEEEIQIWKDCFNFISDVPRESFQPKFDQALFKKNFSTYSLTMQKEFLNIINSYIQDSKLPAGTRKDPKIAYYFQGPPGVGKTHAIHKISQTLDAPVFELKIPSSMSDFCGTPIFPFPTKSASPLLQALHTSRLGQEYRNAIFYIDEFDKILSNPDKQSYIDFFLEFLEGNSKGFRLHNIDFDISHLFIILAGNSDLTETVDIPPENAHSSAALSQKNTATIKAIRDRLKFIKFPALTSRERNEILAESISSYLEQEKTIQESSPDALTLTQEDILEPAVLKKFEDMVSNSTDDGARGVLREFQDVMREIKIEKQKQQMMKDATSVDFLEEIFDEDQSLEMILKNRLTSSNTSKIKTD